MKKKGANVQNDFAQIFDGLKSSSESKRKVKKTIEKKSIEDKNTKETAIEQDAIEQNTIENNAIEQNTIETKSPGIYPTSIRVVKEELLNALTGRATAEVKIGDIAPLTGLTRRTVDRVCRYLEEIEEFKFERQHRGMKVTNLSTNLKP
jgi:hypothetical protein